MAIPKYLRNNAGTVTEQFATVTPVADSIVSTDGTGTIPAVLLPTGIAADTAAITASEALAAGDLVNVWNSTGAKVRKADASVAGKEAHGFVLAAVSSAGTATVYFEGSNPQVTSLTPGVQFLSAITPGLSVSTAPSATGQVVQRVGFAVSPTNLNFQSEIPIVLA